MKKDTVEYQVLRAKHAIDLAAKYGTHWTDDLELKLKEIKRIRRIILTHIYYEHIRPILNEQNVKGAK